MLWTARQWSGCGNEPGFLAKHKVRRVRATLCHALRSGRVWVAEPTRYQFAQGRPLDLRRAEMGALE